MRFAKITIRSLAGTNSLITAAGTNSLITVDSVLIASYFLNSYLLTPNSLM